MEDPTALGRNRTGMQMSPLQSEMLIEASRLAELSAGQPAEEIQPESLLIAETRREYINEADALGSMPPPTTLKGAVKSGVGALTGHRMQVFIDKVAERLAYERGGTRLYDAALVKVIALAEGTPVNVERVKQIRNQEAEHAEMLRQALIALGADPTAQTPCADLVGVQSMGLMQSLTDPRTSLSQALSSLLAAELIDVASWEMLSRLATSCGQDAMANQFDQALKQEESHLDTISRWYEALLNADAKLLS
jgi:ferritin-like metal-binding protein YciE